MANSLLRTETVSYQTVEITVETGTLLTQGRLNQLFARLEGHVAEGEDYTVRYVQLVAQTVKAKGVDIPTYDADLALHVKAFAAYLRLPVALISQLIMALDRVNAPSGAHPGLQPEVTPKSPKPEESEMTSEVA